MPSRADRNFDAAKILAWEARANLKGQALLTRQRLRPERLKQDALDTAHDYMDQAEEVTLATVKEHPVAFGASFLGTLAFWYRKPLKREIDQRSPDVIEGVGNALEKIRDWIAPQNWNAADEAQKKQKE